MNQKYEISEIAHPQYPWLHRIRALSDVRPDVPKGHLGGYVQCEENLSQKGACWIADDAVVCDNARVYGSAWIGNKSHISGQAVISGDAHVGGNAEVLENAHVTSGLVVEQAVIRGDAEIKKDQRTRKSPRISGSALIYGTVVGNVSVSGASVVGKGEKIEGGRNSAFLVCALPGFVDSKNEEKTERNAGYLVVSHSGGGMLRQGTRKGIRRTPANRGMRAHWVVKGLDISEDVCHGMCP